MSNVVDWPLDASDGTVRPEDIVHIDRRELLQGTQLLPAEDMKLVLDAHTKGRFGEHLDGDTLQDIIAFVNRWDRDKLHRKVHSRVGALLVQEGASEEFKGTATFVAKARKSGLLEAISQKGGFVARILASQPNRMYVRTLFATDDGKDFCLVHFDRAGAAYDEWVNIRSDPDVFITLVLTVTSMDMYILGLNPSVKYQTENGKKVGGTISFGGVPYEVVGINPMYIERSRGLCARATTCLRLKNGGKEYVLKSTWRRSGSGLDESSKMERAKGIRGVVQIISSDKEMTTDKLRGVPSSGGAPCARRVQVLMECAGPPTTRFTSELQLIMAFLDVVKGLLGLSTEAGLLHGGVSIGNIVLGAPDARPGERGKLIDLDMALEAKEQNLNWQGTMPYMSITNLQRAILQQGMGDVSKPLYPVPHSTLDDIESVLYVFSHVVKGMDGPSLTEPLLPPELAPSDFQSACAAKIDIFSWSHYETTSNPYWSLATRELLLKFTGFIDKLHKRKQLDVACEPDETVRGINFARLLEEVPAFFDEVQTFFEDALVELAKDETLAASTPLSPHIILPATTSTDPSAGALAVSASITPKPPFEPAAAASEPVLSPELIHAPASQPANEVPPPGELPGDLEQLRSPLSPRKRNINVKDDRIVIALPARKPKRSPVMRRKRFINSDSESRTRWRISLHL